MAKKNTTAKKKPAARKPAARKTTVKKAPEMKSFRVYPDEQSFTSMRFTKQTLYWLVLIVFIVITQLWILKLQLDIAELTNTLTTIVTQ